MAGHHGKAGAEPQTMHPTGKTLDGTVPRRIFTGDIARGHPMIWLGVRRLRREDRIREL